MTFKDYEDDPSLMDDEDPFKSFRNEFHIPQSESGSDEIYMCGNSLGLQPRRTHEYVLDELEKWKTLGVRGHFEGKYPWMPYHEFLMEDLAHIVGAKSQEVVPMNSLTVNLHLMMVSFYKPTKQRHKILIEKHAFPSDYYAVESQITFHGFDPSESLLTLEGDPSSQIIGEDTWIEYIQEFGEEVALVVLPGLQYYTGEALPLAKIVDVAHEKGCLVGVDLAHAVGNIPLNLHREQVDFACWCHYKYLNSGPGAVGGCFVHEKHFRDDQLPKFKGWWGHHKVSRFLMNNQFEATYSAEGWQISNPPIISLACIRASLEVFKDAGGVASLREKSLKLTSYLEFLLKTKLKHKISILTPEDPQRRGCQLSIVLESQTRSGQEIYKSLIASGVSVDWREPNVMRVAPVPLYNSFQDVYDFSQKLQDGINA